MDSEIAVSEASRLVESAQRSGITLRIMGACAFRIHCPNSRKLYDNLSRPITDIDFASYSNHNGKMKPFFDSQKYGSDARVIALFGRERHQYLHPEGTVKVDVFFDRLAMNHIVDFKGRLELDSPTITLVDLLLEKMQIVQLTEKDIKDTIVLLREHPVGTIEKETVNSAYIAKILAEDWGFWYTATANLQKVHDYVGASNLLAEDDKVVVATRLDELKTAIEAHPKSTRWKMRSRIGPKKKWYNDVETVIR
jgi:hypothetical protein